MTSRRQTKSPCDSLHFFTTSTYIDFSRNRNKKADNDYNDYSNKKTLTLMRVVSKLYVHKTCSAIDQAAIKDRRKIVSDVPNAKDTSKGNNPYIASVRFNSDYRIHMHLLDLHSTGKNMEKKKMEKIIPLFFAQHI